MNYARQLAAIQTAIEAHSGDFMQYGRELIELREAIQASGRSLGSLLTEAEVQRRKIYAVINAVEAAQTLGLSDQTAAKIGWSKLAIVSSRLTGDRDADAQLVENAINFTQATLRSRLSDRCQGPVRIVHVALTAGLSRRFEKALSAIAGGGKSNPVRRGKLLLQALESFLDKTPSRTKARPKRLKAA